MGCCDEPWWERLEREVTAPKVKIRKTGGLKLVDIPGVKRRVAIGDEVSVPADRAAQLVAGGEFEHVPTPKPAKANEAAVAAKEGD